MNEIHKYPRTRHLETSKLQDGDEDLQVVPFSEVKGLRLIVEEKIDGSQIGISFNPTDLSMLLQSRGHYLNGGPREKEFTIFKQWAATHERTLLECLEDRYILYLENMFAKHTEFYDLLPHFMMEYDILDTAEGTWTDAYNNEHPGTWLSTERRRDMLSGLPVVSVPVIYDGTVKSISQMWGFIGNSAFKSAGFWEVFLKHFPQYDPDSERALRGTDDSRIMEGLYIKVEEEGKVVDRYKIVRPGFTQMVADSDDHWHDRPIIPNILAPGIDIYDAEMKICQCGQPGEERVDHGILCGFHCSKCFEKMVSEGRSRSW